VGKTLPERPRLKMPSRFPPEVCRMPVSAFQDAQERYYRDTTILELLDFYLERSIMVDVEEL
jgi:hypothetical protein